MPSSIDLDKTFGALLIGFLVSAALYGVTCAQTYHYFNNYNDGVWPKTTVAVLWVFETFHSVFGCHAIYFFVITNYGNPAALARATWSAVLTLVVSNLIMLIVHSFYAKRVWHMSRRNKPVTVVVMLLALAHFAMGIIVAIKAFELQYFSAFVKSTAFVDSSLAFAALTDVFIAASLSYYLHTSRSGIRRTDSMINKLLAYTINNGILTSAFDIITLVFATAEPHNLIFLAVFQVVGNLYTNSMLATLNSRNPHISPFDEVDLSSMQLAGGSITHPSTVHIVQDRNKKGARHTTSEDGSTGHLGESSEVNGNKTGYAL